jgi:hypothetical protein
MSSAREMPEIILGVKGNLQANAIIHVLLSLYEENLSFVEIETAENLQQCYKSYPLIIGEEQIEILGSLRSNGFAGGVLIISRQNRESLVNKYPILAQGSDGHNYCKLNATLADIVKKVIYLEPLGMRNLQRLQKELTNKPRKVLVEINKKLADIENKRKNHQDFSLEIESIRDYIQSICAKTTVICHKQIGNVDWIVNLQQEHQSFSSTSQISQCFSFLLGKDDFTESRITLIKNVSELWCNKCVNTNESLDLDLDQPLE